MKDIGNDAAKLLQLLSNLEGWTTTTSFVVELGHSERRELEGKQLREQLGKQEMSSINAHGGEIIQPM